MALGFLSRLFSRGEAGASPDLSGPLSLLPGDRVEYYQQRLVVRGIVALSEGKEYRHQYHLTDSEGRPSVLVAEGDREIVLSFQSPLPPGADPPLIRLTAATWGGRPYTRTHEGTEQSVCVGDIPPEKSGIAETLVYEDGDGIRLLVQEQWGDFAELRAGEYVHEGEIVIHRQGDDEYVARPPPKVDLKSMNEARRARIAVRVEHEPLDAAGLASLRRQESLRRAEDAQESEPDQDSMS